MSRNTAIMAAVLIASMCGSAMAQKPTTEVWPEFDIYWTPAMRQRTFLELSRSAERDGPKNDATVGLYQDYLRLPIGYLRAGYRHTWSTRDASYRESRGVLEGTISPFRPPLVRVVNRTRLELRWVNSDYSYRVRDRIHVQKQNPIGRRMAWAPYGTFEAYYDSKYNTIAKLGARVGTEFRVSKPLGFDLYIARQNNSRTAPRYVNALGLTTRLDF